MSDDRRRSPRRGDRSRDRSEPERSGRAGRPAAGPRGQRRTTTSRPSSARDVALDLLTAIRERDAYANLELPALLRKAGLDQRDTALATELAYGTARTAGLLDRVVASAAGRSTSKIEPEVLDVLRLGTYQLLYTRIGDHAAVDTSVELAKRRGMSRATGFVNAVLHKVARQDLTGWTAELQKSTADPIARLALGSAHPEWIVRAFAEALGPAAGELPALLRADDERPEVHLAARPGAITAEELALISGGDEGRLSPYAVHLPSGSPSELEPVRDGLAAVQDEGSQLVAVAAATIPLEGQDAGRWLDLCAGPGGKASMLGALAEIEGAHVTAVEVAPHRAALVEKAVSDLPVTVRVADGRDPGLDPGFDRILVDAPCSGLGALRRRPESRWRRQPTDVSALVPLQRELLASALRLVRPGGVVVYATCSPHLAETVSVVKDAARRSGAEFVDVRGGLPEPAVAATADDPGPWVQLWPHRHGTDAMFMAALRRT